MAQTLFRDLLFAVSFTDPPRKYLLQVIANTFGKVRKAKQILDVTPWEIQGRAAA